MVNLNHFLRAGVEAKKRIGDDASGVKGVGSQGSDFPS